MIKTLKQFSVLALLLSTTSFSYAFSSTEFNRAHAVVTAFSILRFEEVSPGLYRGARPEYKGVQELSRMGMKTIINIETDRYAIEKEKKIADKLGLITIGNPMSAYKRPTDQQVNDLLKEMTDKKNYPLFLHCKHGQDRTGMMFGIYRVEIQGWTPEAAYKEMLAIGFHPSLTELDQYYRDRTGYTGP